ncbi:DMT family transporter [Alkaliphilus peptidifermentans]|uniref:Uncharacterized membrane protein YdcZ, DUF606 family n=1 Tax=Alkaliphilus peptidifermentans DSM 18978 TaxID=1120976 RepID=A0A1G5KSU6_9FIRM|nr:DMT family transporter [Alkaliphilus peptidifermentans]SCZ03241.1 Uncharacterized membrane protein YdcZ, DUF606 family [Alkaliphilus peptidifermentans DSM 18978]
MNKGNSKLLILLLFMGFMNSGIVLINGLLAQYTDLYLAGLIVHIVGFFPALIFFLAFDKDKLIYWRSTFKSDKKIFFAGFIGSLILVISAFCMARIGVFLTSIAMVAGQFVLSVIVDINGFFGFKKVKLELRKVSAIFIILLGVILISV